MKRKFTKKATLTPEEVARKDAEVAQRKKDKAIKQRTFDDNNDVARVDTPLKRFARIGRRIILKNAVVSSKIL